jgi:hypothetical protein
MTEPTSHSPVLSDAQWDAALRNQPLPDTPVDLLLIAQTVRDALQKETDAVTPTDADVDHAWQSVLKHAKAQGLLAPKLSWWQRLAAQVATPQRWAPALAFALVAGVILNLMLGGPTTDMEIANIRGSTTMVVADADAAEPKLVAELRALALLPIVTPQANGALVEVTWPAMPTAAQSQWLAKHGLVAAPQGNLKVLLLKTAP